MEGTKEGIRTLEGTMDKEGIRTGFVMGTKEDLLEAIGLQALGLITTKGTPGLKDILNHLIGRSSRSQISGPAVRPTGRHRARRPRLEGWEAIRWSCH